MSIGELQAEAWAPNVMTFTLGSAIDVNSTTNTALAQAGSIASYHQRNIEFYRCPEDNFLSRIQKTAGWKYRLRSVGMNERAVLVRDARDRFDGLDHARFVLRQEDAHERRLGGSGR